MFLNCSYKTTKILIGLVLFFSFFYFSQLVNAADVSISPASGNYTPGQTFTATVRVLPNGQDVNAVEASLSFDPSILSVVSVNRDGSVFSLWTTEPTFSNSDGTITFGGGSPSPFSNTSNIMTVTFRTVAAGSGEVGFGDVSVLAADGRGTDVFENAIGATYTIGGAPTPTTPESETTPTPTPDNDDESEEAIIFGDPPRAPEIGSQAFLDPNEWYNDTEGLFTWTLPFDVNAMAIEIATSSENQPELNEDAIVDPPVEEFLVTKDLVTDGVQYLSIKFKNQVDWGAVTNRKLQIDTTPPQPFAINVRTGSIPSDFPLLNFEAEDVTSGIDFYELTIADNEPLTVTPDEAKLGYLLSELEDGTYTVKVVAHDLAGNTRESSVAVLITAGWIKPVELEDERTVWDYLTPLNLFILFLIIVIILMAAYLWHERKVLREREEKLRRETREIQDQMEKIFSALRDEIYDQVNTITKRKRLSQSEREAVENLTQALEVSETLIEKEVNDVKSILK